MAGIVRELFVVGRSRCDGRQAVPEVKELCQKVMEPALQAPRRPDSDDLAHQQPEIEGTAVDQHPLRMFS